MSGLVYIVVVSAKNRLLDIVRRPAKLLQYLLAIAGIAGLFIMSLFTRNAVENFLDMIWLKAIIFAFVLLFFIIAIQKGLKSGDTIFDMSDVNLLFVSPLNPRSILLYGVIRMMSMSFLAGFFILFQGNSLGMWFGVYFNDILLIFAAFILAVSLMQILSLSIYSLTNGNSKRKLMVRIITAIMFLPMITEIIRQIAQTGGDMMKALESLLRSPVTAWTPVVGWVSEGAIAFIAGDISTGLLFFGITIAVGALL